MVREALQVTEVAIKLSALGIKNALALSLAYAKENPKVKGKTSLDRLLREGKELKIIALQSKDVGQFKELAKQYGVLFAVIKDKAQNEKVDVMFKAEDVAKLNRIYEQLVCAVQQGCGHGKTVVVQCSGGQIAAAFFQLAFGPLGNADFGAAGGYR